MTLVIHQIDEVVNELSLKFLENCGAAES